MDIRNHAATLVGYCSPLSITGKHSVFRETTWHALQNWRHGPLTLDPKPISQLDLSKPGLPSHQSPVEAVWSLITDTLVIGN
ncbi:hypothetical protein MAR_032169 [Mya arenaria]|uniref:Uncharacterized protein n=1 Tax=Mya arenaria TaxID=6604 RepID=A0ABY7F6M8_MYAAR|nr:hypothetical protein MAR_032169 [Mya arenaria]